ncbi:adaptin N terminal region-domain-containing protein [Mycena floridula]|nr:adaptin N terminal region-domain-containing protein [Mycena floridula]
MSAIYLNTISENATRLGMRLQESLSEHIPVAARSSSSAYLDDDKVKNIRKQLDSSSDREKLDAMKRLIALISKGRNVSEYFAQVVKNVASHSLEIRKLVYIYLLRYAEQEPDLALLSINTFQKDLTDSNPLIRAMALRVLSGIKVPMIANIVVLAIKKAAADISPYVRKVAALAISECNNLDNSHLSSLIEIITTLLRDRSPLAVGSVIVAFEAVCPTRLDLIHQQYRRLCKILVDVDEWGQVDLLNLLLRYARTMLPRPIVGPGGAEELDKDIKTLVKSAEPLLMSRNPATVLAAVRVFYYGGTPSYHPQIVQPLLRLLHESPEVESVVLSYILIISRTSPKLFADFHPRFLLRTTDVQRSKRDKISILLKILTTDTHQAILRELIDYTDDPDDSIVADAIRGIGLCAHMVPECRQQCLNALIGMIKSTVDTVISNAVLVLKNLIQRQMSEPSAGGSQSPVSLISQLAHKIDDIRHPQARACLLWLVGQYAGFDSKGQPFDGVAEWAPDVLRKAAKSFGQEPAEVKLQIVTLAAKLFLLSPADRILGLLNRYVFALARYDLNYDVRDRARMVSSLLAGVLPPDEQAIEERAGVVLRREQVRLVLFSGKSETVDLMSHTGDDPNARLGSLGAITGKDMHDDVFLPDWLENGVESSLRDSDADIQPISSVPVALSSAQQQRTGGSSSVVLTPRSSSPAPKNAGWNDLDKFYEEDDESEEGEEEGEGEEEESEEEEDDVDAAIDDTAASESDGSESNEEDSEPAVSSDPPLPH